MTRGKPTVVAPESLLTFRVEQPLLISTTQSPNAFTTVAREDYAQSMRPGPGMGQGGAYGRPYYGYGPGVGAPYPYYYGAPYWNTGFFFYGGPRYYRGWRRW